MKTRNHSLLLRLEALEHRELMAGNIAWNAIAGSFTINGDNVLNDEARVSIVSGKNFVRVELGHRNGFGQMPSEWNAADAGSLGERDVGVVGEA